jgi:chromate transporter
VLGGDAPYHERLRMSGLFRKAIEGVLCSFVGLLLCVKVRLAMNVLWDLPRILLAIAAFMALRLKVNILCVVLIGTIISVLVF